MIPWNAYVDDGRIPIGDGCLIDLDNLLGLVIDYCGVPLKYVLTPAFLDIKSDSCGEKTVLVHKNLEYESLFKRILSAYLILCLS